MVENRGACPPDCKLHLTTLDKDIMGIKAHLKSLDSLVGERIKWATFAWIVLIMSSILVGLFSAIWHEVSFNNRLMSRMEVGIATITEKTDNIEERINDIVRKANSQRSLTGGAP